MKLTYIPFLVGVLVACGPRTITVQDRETVEQLRADMQSERDQRHQLRDELEAAQAREEALALSLEATQDELALRHGSETRATGLMAHITEQLTARPYARCRPDAYEGRSRRFVYDLGRAVFRMQSFENLDCSGRPQDDREVRAEHMRLGPQVTEGGWAGYYPLEITFGGGETENHGAEGPTAARTLKIAIEVLGEGVAVRLPEVFALLATWPAGDAEFVPEDLGPDALLRFERFGEVAPEAPPARDGSTETDGPSATSEGGESTVGGRPDSGAGGASKVGSEDPGLPRGWR